METGAFDVEPAPAAGGAGGAAISGVGTGTPRDYVLAVAEQFEAVDPTATLDLQEGEPDFDALCAGDIDLVATTGNDDEDVCGDDNAVGFHVANARGEPLVIYVNRESLNRFEIEGLIQFAVDNGETLPETVGAEPLSIDELQETQTKLEQVVAGIA